MSDSQGFEVYKSITEVMGELAKEGISKGRKNQQQGFQYRGIDDCYNALAPFLAKSNLCILPRMVEIKETERVSAKGGTLFYSQVKAEFDFVSAIDGSKHTVGPVYGEAFDSGDKSIGKAMSYAYKAMAFMAFAIPTEGDNDPDANVHKVKPRQQAPKSATQGAKTTQGTQGAAPQLSEAQTKYLPRIKAALDTLHGADVAAKKATIKAHTAMPAKGEYPAREGVEDYRTLDGKRIEFLAHALEALAKKAAPELCNECRQPNGNHSPSCPNAAPPQ